MHRSSFFFFNDPPPTEIYTLSLHDALPISVSVWKSDLAARRARAPQTNSTRTFPRSEEHTSELQSLRHLVCRLLLEKKKLAAARCRAMSPADIAAQLPHHMGVLTA